MCNGGDNMTITEVFPNPTVKQVIFQIRYPNLFFIEDKIGDFQVQILQEFPKSALAFRRQIMLADLGPDAKLPDIQGSDNLSTKVWQFISDKGFRLNVLTDSLDITSEFHKTYNLDGGEKFRDTIRFVLDAFLKIVPLPVINRLGLRYIDECPIPKKTNRVFRTHYNSVFPLKRFDLADASEMSFRTTVRRGDYNIRYAESLAKIADDNYKLILDFDGFANSIVPAAYLDVTDALHDIIRKEYENTIKAPIYTFMRKPKS